jgi:hypothetical protein
MNWKGIVEWEKICQQYSCGSFSWVSDYSTIGHQGLLIVD